MTAKLPSSPIFDIPSPAAQKLELLRELFPAAVQTDEHGHITVSAAAIQQALDPANPAGIRVEEDGYELRWAGKREAYHTAFVPPERILRPLPDDSKDWDTTGNVVLKGDNLDALRLLRQSYFGAVKVIYIDPPYNTQSEAFIYRDDFSARQTDILKTLGYSADALEYVQNIYGARTHSGWLSFMYPRLLLAKDLLADDGVIFISIDDNEQAQLKVLCDEVFGQENFLGQIVWKNVTDNNPTNIATEHEYAICYARNKVQLETTWKSRISDVKDRLIEIGERFIAEYPDSKTRQKAYSAWLKENKTFLSPLDRYKYIDDGGIYTGSQSVHNPGREGYRYDVLHPRTQKPCKQPLMGYRFPESTMLDLVSKERILFGKDETKIIELKVYVHEYEDKLSSVLTMDGRVGSYELREHFPEVAKVFDNPKPSTLVSQLIAFPSDRESIILDFFGGSGTTAEAVMRLNAEDGGARTFILVQIPQPIDPKKQKEAYAFVTDTLGKPDATIFEITAERIRRAGAALAAEHSQLDTGFRVYELVEDPDALVLSRPLAKATQDDIAELQLRITTPQPQYIPQVLANLLLAEGLPLSARLEALEDGALYRAEDVLFWLQPQPVARLRDVLREARAAGRPIHAISAYAPWLADDNLLLGLKTVLETLDMSEDKLRLRG
jgi:adenine-specific DNA-methyltransferase